MNVITEESAFNFFVNAILTCYCCSQIFKLFFTFSKDLLAISKL